MSHKGNCWDGVLAESFFSTIKEEFVELSDFVGRKQAAAAIFEYIEVFYNRIRVRSDMGYSVPEEFEMMHIQFKLRI